MDPDSDLTIDISDTQTHLRLDHDQVATWTRRILTLLGVEQAELSLALVDNPTIQVINRRHLEHDWPTDVISFPDTDPDAPDLSGEVVISTEMAVTTAARIGVDPFGEFLLYLVHGLLHLRGSDDQTTEAAAAMRRREAEVLDALNVPQLFSRPTPAASGSGANASVREKLRWSV